MKLHYLESFYSIQGEGSRMGVPSVFLRTYGCNFRCQNFGMPRGEVSNEYLTIDPSQYDDLTKMPLVRTGCDSYASWDPRCKHLVKKEDASELAKTLTALTPNGNFEGIDLVITGGEPLLGWQKAYPELLGALYLRGLKNVTFETNTTQPLSLELKESLQKFPGEILFSCSPKLSISGEKWEDAIVPGVAKEYFDVAGSSMYFKFVVDSEQDLDEVQKAIDEYKEMGVDAPIYLMPAGGCEEEYNQIANKVALLAMERGWRYSPRLHLAIFGNAWST